MVVYFSARLDETGTDGNSPYTVVGGAVATVDQWEGLEAGWGALLARNGVSAFHTYEFNTGIGDFAGWSPFKRKRFVEAMEKICKLRTLFRVSVGVEDAAHSEIKQRMQGIKGFRPDSNYGLCLRYLMFLTCQTIETNGFNDFRLSILVEDGPWAAGAADVYSRVSRMTNTKWKPAKHAHRLDGFASGRKGSTRTLEAADYLVGVAHQRLTNGRFKKSESPQLSLLLNRSMLERWYDGMLKEKEIRRAYGAHNR